MKVLVTGASGYIGSMVIMYLHKKKIPAVALCRNEASIPDLPLLNKVKGDLTDPDTIVDGLWGCDHVIHAGAFVKMDHPDHTIFYRTNVRGSQALLEKASRCGVKRFVLVSTSGVTGPHSECIGSMINSRTTPFTNHYDSSKAIAESIAMQYALQGMDLVITRIPRVYGPGESSVSAALTGIIRKYIDRNWHFIPGNGTAIASFSYSLDISRGIINALIFGKNGAIYSLGGVNTSFNTFFDTIKFVCGNGHRLYNLPEKLMRVAANVNVFMNRVSGTYSGLTPELVEKVTTDYPVDSSKAISEIGYYITPLEEGIHQTVNWIRRS